MELDGELSLLTITSAVVSSDATRQQGSGFEPGAFLCRVSVSDMQVNWQLLPVGVKGSVGGCLSLCVSPCDRHFQGAPHILPTVSWDWLQRPRDPQD